MAEQDDTPSDPGGDQGAAGTAAEADGAHGARADPVSVVPKVDGDSISAKVRRSFELVPEIGTRWRWYDVPYRCLSWMLSSWRRRLLPWQLRYRLNSALNFFIPFNHYERLKIEPVDDPMENLIVPSSEEVTQGGIWVVEFFPPSYYSALYDALRKNGWDEQSHLRAIHGTNAEQVTRARREKGFAWSRIGTVAKPDSRYLVFDAKREFLPEEFDLVELTAVQLGSSLTAVTAFVRLSEQGRGALNRVWKARHEPIFEWQGLRRPHVEGRYFAAIRATQRERQRLHDLARTWLAERCGGYFAGTRARQPVVDFTLFKEFDPSTATGSRGLGDPLRALGMGGNYLYNYVSPQLPGAVFVQGEALRRPTEALQNCWGVVGAYEVVARLNDRVGYGSKPYSVSTLAAMADDSIRSFLLHVAVVHYTDQLGETFSDARDTARSKHRGFKPRQLDQLKRELLTTSLDLPVMARDTALLWRPYWQRWNGIDVRAVPTPGVTNPPEEFDLIERLGEVRTKAFEKLVEEDTAYRDVLSTVSALGASAASARLGRRALLVSGTSLLVSITALLIANGATAWLHLVEWLTAL